MFGGVLFTPGMTSLLTYVLLGVTSVNKHDGESVAKYVCDVCDSCNINQDKIAGFVFHDQYFHLKVYEYIKANMGLSGPVGSAGLLL